MKIVEYDNKDNPKEITIAFESWYSQTSPIIFKCMIEDVNTRIETTPSIRPEQYYLSLHTSTNVTQQFIVSHKEHKEIMDLLNHYNLKFPIPETITNNLIHRPIINAIMELGVNND